MSKEKSPGKKSPGKKSHRTKRGKYLDWITPEGLTKLEGWARRGLTDEQLAKNIGINVATIYVWKKEHPKIAEALKKGKEIADIEVENALYKRALGYEYEETKTIIEKDEKGNDRIKRERVTKQQAPDVTAAIFWLKNRQPDLWRNNPTEQDRKEQEARIKRLEAEVAALEQQDAEQPIEINIVSRDRRAGNGSPTDN